MISEFSLRGLRDQQCSRREEGPDTSGKLFYQNKVVREILIAVRQSSGIETSVLSYGGTSISTGARLSAA
jgi:hypothetical protein